MSIIILVRIITKNTELMKYEYNKDIILKMWGNFFVSTCLPY